MTLFFEKAISKHAEVSKIMQKSVLLGPILAWLYASFLALACRSAKGILHKTCFTNSQSPFAQGTITILRQHIFGFFLTQPPTCQHNYSIDHQQTLKLSHVCFVQQFLTLVWDDTTIIYLLFSFCQVKKREQIVA